MNPRLAKIFLAYHRESPLIQSSLLTPIQVGRANHPVLPGMVGDDTGDNISDRNDSYCEMTGVYWAWKNVSDADYVGHMHYRRLFEFRSDRAAPPAERFIERLDIDTYVAEADRWLEANLSDYDLVCPIAHTMHKTVHENYVSAHRTRDWEQLRNAVAEDFPHIYPTFEEVAERHDLRLANMFVMGRALFEEYCAFVFPVLERLYADRGGVEYSSAYNQRNIGFAAERLFTVFVEYVRQHRNDVRIKELNILNLSRATVIPYGNEGQFNSPTDVNIACAADEAFVPHLAVMLRSLADHVNEVRRYNIFLLSSEVSGPTLESLASMLRRWPNIHLHVIPMNNMFDDSYRSKTRAPSNATYNRLLLFQLFPFLDRMLYIDADMVVLCDPAEIFDHELAEHQIAAVPDYIMTRTVSARVATRDPNVPDLGHYQQVQLGLSRDQQARYFNAGLLLFNFAKMDTSKVGADLLALAGQGGYLFRDQDILNSYFKDSYLPLSAKYNVFNSPEAAYTKVPAANRAKAIAAKGDPKVVHFASGEHKPWSCPGVEFSGLYWRYLLETPFYLNVIQESTRPNRRLQVDPARSGNRFIRAGKAIERMVPAARPALLRVRNLVFK